MAIRICIGLRTANEAGTFRDSAPIEIREGRRDRAGGCHPGLVCHLMGAEARLEPAAEDVWRGRGRYVKMGRQLGRLLGIW